MNRVFHFYRESGNLLDCVINTINNGCCEDGIIFEEGKMIPDYVVGKIIRMGDDVITEFDLSIDQESPFYNMYKNIQKFNDYLVELADQYDTIWLVYHEEDISSSHEFEPNDLLLYYGSEKWLKKRLKKSKSSLCILGYMAKED